MAEVMGIYKKFIQMELNNKNSNFLKILIQGGLASVAIIALIMFYQVVSNHIGDNTAALMELKGSITDSNRIDQDQVEATDDLVEVIDDLKDVILQIRNPRQ